MKILSNFKDYYDIGLQHGVDEDILYKRFEEKYEYSKLHLNFNKIFSISFTTYTWKFYIIGFCGDIYFNVDIVVKDIKPVFGTIINTQKFELHTKTFSEINTFINEKCNFKFKQNHILESNWFRKHRTKTIEELTIELKDIFHKYNIPVFLISQEKDDEITYNNYITLTLNPQLRNYNFQKAVDPYQAFQQISQYVGGVLNQPSNPLTSIEDKYRIQAHGFDKYSFRKLPSKKK